MAYSYVQKNKCVFHITHLNNIPAVIKKGILSKNLVQKERIQFKDISEDKIQEVRARKVIPFTEHTLHDCVPMFFGARPPMLYAVRFKGILQEEIVYVLVSWDILKREDVWFTDGNARSDKTNNFYQGEEHLDKVDFNAVEAHYWGEDDELKRKRQAEVLKLNSVLLDDIVGFVVYNDSIKIKLESMLIAQRITKKVFIAREFYY